jgi:hypothetical protein
MTTHGDSGMAAEFLPGFEPVTAFWEGENPLFPSESSARWALTRARQALVNAGALALHRNRMYVHRERAMQVINELALAEYRRRYAPDVAGA